MPSSIDKHGNGKNTAIPWRFRKERAGGGSELPPRSRECKHKHNPPVRVLSIASNGSSGKLDLMERSHSAVASLGLTNASNRLLPACGRLRTEWWSSPCQVLFFSGSA